MTNLSMSAPVQAARLSRTGLLFALLGGLGLLLPLVQFKANRIVLGEALALPGASESRSYIVMEEIKETLELQWPGAAG